MSLSGAMAIGETPIGAGSAVALQQVAPAPPPAIVSEVAMNLMALATQQFGGWRIKPAPALLYMPPRQKVEAKPLRNRTPRPTRESLTRDRKERDRKGRFKKAA